MLGRIMETARTCSGWPHLATSAWDPAFSCLYFPAENKGQAARATAPKRPTAARCARDGGGDWAEELGQRNGHPAENSSALVFSRFRCSVRQTRADSLPSEIGERSPADTGHSVVDSPPRIGRKIEAGRWRHLRAWFSAAAGRCTFAWKSANPIKPAACLVSLMYPWGGDRPRAD